MRRRGSASLRILFTFEGGFPIVGYGGGHQIVRGFSRVVSEMGHDVRVVLGGSDEVRASIADNVTYACLARPSSKRRVAHVAVAALKVIAEWKPDVVCCFTGELAFLAPVCGALGVPIFTYIADPQLFRVGLSRAGIRQARSHTGQFFQRMGALAARKVFTISDHTSRQAVEMWGLPRRRVATIGTGLDRAFIRATVAPLQRVRGAALRLISVGRIAFGQKPLDVMADALVRASIPWVHWTIVGTGAHEEQFKTHIEQLGLSDRVHFAGFLAPQAVVNQLSSHDLVLLPSRYESFFMTPYEAIACNRMVLTNDVAEVKTSLAGNPMLVLAEDASVPGYQKALREAWHRLENPVVFDESLSHRVQHAYSWQNIGGRFLEAIRESSRR